MSTLYDDVMMQKRGRVIVDLAQVKKGEKVLVLCDFQTAGIGELLASQVYQTGAMPFLVVIPPLKAHGDPVPEPIHKMAMEVDVILAPMMASIAHTQLRTDAVKKGIRLMVLAGADETYLAKGAFDVDFNQLRPRVERLAEILTRAKQARVTNAKGTDITMSVEGREAQAFTGFAEKGKLSALPCVEVNCSPVEGSAEGKIVADVGVDDMPPELSSLGLLAHPIQVSVKGGFAREITGGEEARKLKEFLASLQDPNVYNIAELGLGMNPGAKADGSNLLNEGSQDNIHIALGTNVYFPGGTIKAKGHFDLVMSFCTLELDGVPVIKDGKPVFV